MEVRTLNRAVLGALVKARRVVEPVYETETAQAEIPGKRGQWREWDHPHREDVRRACTAALRSAGLDLVVVERCARGEVVSVGFALVLVDKAGEVVEVEEWESTIPLDARESPSASLAALGAATLLEVHTLLDLLRPEVLPRSEKARRERGRSELDQVVGEMPSWGDPPAPSEPAPLVKLTCGPGGEVVRVPVVEEPPPLPGPEEEIEVKRRVIEGARRLGIGVDAAIRSAVKHGRRPLEIDDWRLVEAEIARLEEMRRDQLAAVEVGHG